MSSGSGHGGGVRWPSMARRHYLLNVKANQPTLLARCAGLPWHRVPVLDRTRDRDHGRLAVRTLKAVTVHRFGFPHAAQVLQVTRKRKARDRHARPSVGGGGP